MKSEVYEAIREEVCGFRRTLVGLKPADLIAAVVLTLFQTNPCGVEASIPLTRDSGRRSFRRTLVGLKLAAFLSLGDEPEFQTNPCGVEAHPPRADVPL